MEKYKAALFGGVAISSAAVAGNISEVSADTTFDCACMNVTASHTEMYQNLRTQNDYIVSGGYVMLPINGGEFYGMASATKPTFYIDFVAASTATFHSMVCRTPYSGFGYGGTFSCGPENNKVVTSAGSTVVIDFFTDPGSAGGSWGTGNSAYDYTFAMLYPANKLYTSTGGGQVDQVGMYHNPGILA